MLHGDISNQRSFAIGFRCENTLLVPREGLFAKAASLFSNQWVHADVDKEVLAVMKDLYWNTEYTVSLVVDNATFKNPAFQKRIEDFPMNTVLNVFDHISEVTMWLNTGELSYLVVNDIIEKSLVNSQYAVSIEEFARSYHIKRKGRLHY